MLHRESAAMRLKVIKDMSMSLSLYILITQAAFIPLMMVYMLPQRMSNTGFTASKHLELAAFEISCLNMTREIYVLLS